MKTGGLKMIAIAAAILIALLTIYQAGQALWLQLELGRVKAHVAELEKRYEPYRSLQEKLDESKRVREVADSFEKEAPQLLPIIYEFARLIPKDGWIRTCTIRGDRVRIAIEGGSAVKMVEILKKSPMFKSVTLASSVTRTRDQQERYTLELRLKEG